MLRCFEYLSHLVPCLVECAGVLWLVLLHWLAFNHSLFIKFTNEFALFVTNIEVMTTSYRIFAWLSSPICEKVWTICHRRSWVKLEGLMLVGARCEATVEKPPETNMIGGKSENNSFREKEIRKKSLEILVLPLHLSINHPFSFFGGCLSSKKGSHFPNHGGILFG